ncbi:hypothetical protein IW145_004952 [Coemansia sp. RSA 521]|nr:hypothetical protein IW145_004952 [Coemansia sp. RSA 521]
MGSNDYGQGSNDYGYGNDDQTTTVVQLVGTDTAETLNNGAPVATVGTCPDFTITVTSQVFATLTTTITPSWLAVPGNQQNIPNAGFAEPTGNDVNAVNNGNFGGNDNGGDYNSAGDYGNAGDYNSAGGNDNAGDYNSAANYDNASDYGGPGYKA